MAKNKASFIFYYNQFKNKIYAYFLYRVNFDKKLAEDLTSEVFLKALKSFAGFNGDKPFQPWIFTISRNHLINYYKSCKREVALETVENFLPYTDNSAVERYELEQVMRVINRMEAGDREILLLRYAQGLNNSEIAELLNKEEGAVRTQFSRSLAKLREILYNEKPN